MLGDLQTYVDGIREYVKNKTRLTDGLPRGGGNISLASLSMSALETMASLYAGTTSYGGTSYNAQDNVEKFVNDFFPTSRRQIPLLLWDGVRNGLVHIFSPKAMKRGNEVVKFTFYVEDESVHSHAEKNGNTIVLWINSIELFTTLRDALERYRLRLDQDATLQANFKNAWNSSETYTRDITADTNKSAEVLFIDNELSSSTSGRVNLLS
jgi:hypothetical protein